MPSILIVDDMAVLREPLELCLRSKGYQTASAENGKAALAQCERNWPDLVVLDLEMPVMGGLEFLRATEAERLKRRTPVILLTGHVDRESVLAAGRLGVQDCLLKTQCDLRTILDRVVRRMGGAKQDAQSSSAQAAPEASPPTLNAASGRPAQTHPAKKGTGELLAELKAELPAAEVEKLVQTCGELQGFSPAVSAVLQMTSHSIASPSDLARTIKQDPAISLKVLRLANSAMYMRGAHIESVDEAVLRIGMSQIRQAVLSLGVVDRFGGIAGHGGIDYGRFWEHSIACGTLAAELTRAAGGSREQADDAFMSGLIHDVGRIILADRLGDLYAEVMRASRELRLPLDQVERKMLSVNHAEFLGRILKSWRLPGHLIHPVARHHVDAAKLRVSSDHSGDACAILSLANRLAHALLPGTSPNRAVYTTENLAEGLNLAEDALAKIEEMLPERIADMRLALLSRSTQNDWGAAAADLRKALPVPFAPLFLSTRPRIDVLAHFCSALRGSDTDHPSSLAVVHLHSPAELPGLFAQLQSAEREAGTTALPILLITPLGSLEPDLRPLQGRHVIGLQTPFTVDQFIEVLSDLGTTESKRAA